MASARQIAANRRNAEKCTGPKTSGGKAVSSMNALKAGIDIAAELMRRESKDDLEQLTAEYYEDFAPANAIERALLDQLIKNEWLSRRYAAAEPSVCASITNRIGRENHGTLFIHSQDAFVKLDRIRNSAQRNYHRAMKELLGLRKARNAEMPVREPAHASPQPDAQKPLNPELVSFPTFTEPPASQPQPPAEIRQPYEVPLTIAA